MIAPQAHNSLEQERIADIKRLIGDRFIGDDAAILPYGYLASVDTLVEGVHFPRAPRDLPSLGWKSAAAGLSDIAAMGGRPLYMLVAISMPAGFGRASFLSLYQGLQDCAQMYRTAIVGGDLTAGSALTITVCIIGQTHECGALRRSAAQPGDLVAVSGDLGASRAGLFLVEERQEGYSYCRQRHLRPQPRLQEGWLLAHISAGRATLMDASDGLADALVQIARASDVGMEVEIERIPFHDQTAAVAKISGVSLADWLLYGGEDYELVACLSEESGKELVGEGKAAGLASFSIIGRVTADRTRGVRVSQAGRFSQVDLKKAFQHWTGQAE